MGKVISTILVILLAPAFFVLVFFISLKLTVMSPDFIKEELSEQKAYEKIHTNLLEVVDAIGEDEEVTTEGQGALDSAEMTTAIQGAVTPEVAEKTTEIAIDIFWPWLFSGQKNLGVVDMRELKVEIRTNVMDAFKSKYESLPYCLSANDFSDSDIVCRHPDLRFDDVMNQLSNNPAKSPIGVIDNIPDDLDPNTLISGDGIMIAEIESVRSVTRVISNLVYLASVVFLIICILLARLFAGSWKKVFNALGIFFIILGSISLVGGLLLSRLGSNNVSSLLDESFNNIPNLKTQLIMPITEDVLTKIGNTISTISVSILIIGIIFVVGSIVLVKVLSKDNEKK